MVSTFGNSILPDSHIDIYMSARDENGNIMYGKLFSSIKVLAVHDGSGHNVFADPSIGQICHIISIGVTCALVMILCFLPGMLAVCDRFVVKKTAYPSK